MKTEFTGERVVPGQVDEDLWNEHLARYAFACRLARGRRVLDVGCGTGYGTSELAAIAVSATGVDVSSDALVWGRTHYTAPNLRWARASAADLPFRSGAFDLVVAFEVIEHLADWRKMLSEARRVLAHGGQLVVSTPNKSFYAKTREIEGPNPYHEHEFEYDEFRQALLEVFPHVSMFLEDHTEGVVFRAAKASGAAEVRIETSGDDPAQASFFVAVCAASPQIGAPTFVYIPRAANILAEKLLHIERLEGEVKTKDGWLAEAQGAHSKLLDAHRALELELKRSNGWAASLNEMLEAAGKRIVQLQDELAELRTGCEAQIAQLNEELEKRTQWAMETEQRLTSELEIRTADLQTQTAELGRCVEILHETEATLAERTRWALELNQQKLDLEALVQAAQLSRWVRLGRAVGLGPELNRR